MRTLAKVVLCVAVVGLLAGCDNPPVSTQRSNNSAITVDKLFDNDGCTVYRFVDGGRNIYYAKCGAQATQATTMWEQQVGKSSYPVVVTTN